MTIASTERTYDRARLRATRATLRLGSEIRAARPYDRPPLSKEYLRGDATRETLSVHGPTFYDEHDIDLRTSVHVQATDPGSRAVLLDDGSRLGYERLLLATGAEPRRLDVPGADPGLL